MSGFEELFGHSPTARAEAPGRVNLIGEHTDYNGGYVLPMPIPQRTCVELAPAPGTERVRAWSGEMAPEPGPLEYFLSAVAPGRGWLDYLQGVTEMLRQDGHCIGGFDVRIESTVPPGSGLSSSAALEVALLRGLRQAFSLPIDDLQIALLAHRAESGFVGAPVGLMDQMVCSLGRPRHALFLDTRSLCFEHVPLPAAGEIGVIDSGLPHRHAAGEYRTRRAECERAAALLGVGLLRDLGPADLPRLGGLPEPLLRRVRHVIMENERVLAAVQALRQGDLPRLGQLFRESHASMRDDYQVSVPEIDLLVELSREEPFVFGARLTGGGFGGSIVLLARAGSARAAAERVAGRYAARTGIEPTVLVPPASKAQPREGTQDNGRSETQP